MSSKSSTTSSNSLPTKIHISPSPSTSRPDEMASLISDFEDDQFTTPPCQPSPNKNQDVRFYVESVNEQQQPRQKASVFSTASAPAAARKKPTIASLIAVSSRTLINGSVASGGSSNGTGSGGGTLPPVSQNNMAHPLTRTSLPGSVPRSLEAMANNSTTAAQLQAQAQQFQFPPNFYDMQASSFYARAFHSQMPITPFDPHHPHFSQNSSSNQHQFEPLNRHRGELAIHEKYRYDLSKSQLKASSRTSALLAGFAMVALVELQYEETTPHWLMILLGIVTTLLVSVHLLSLMISTCLLPYIEATGCTQDSPHIRLGSYIELSWIFSTCIGLILFLLEIVIIFVIKFHAVGFDLGGYITTAMLIPVLIVFAIISWLIHRLRFSHSVERANNKVVDLEKFIDENELHNNYNTETKSSNLVQQKQSVVQNI